VADWYDQRANHVIPEDTWDKTNGRIWKIIYRGTKPLGKFDLTGHSSGELVDLLSHANAWHRREARRILAERRDPAVLTRLRTMIDAGGEHVALEALWTLYASGGWSDQVALALVDHPSADVRAWTVRLIGDAAGSIPAALGGRLARLAATEQSPVVRSQLACTCKRLAGNDALPIIAQLLRRDEDAGDAHIPLLLWWAIEDKAVAERAGVLDLLSTSAAWQLPLVRGTILERLARRYIAERSEAGYAACARLLALAPSGDGVRLLVAAMEKEFTGRRLAEVPPPLAGPLAKLWREDGSDPTVTRLALRLGSSQAYRSALVRLADSSEPQSVRVALIAAVGQAGEGDAVAHLLPLLDDSQGETVRTAALAALAHFGDEAIARAVLARYARFSPALRSSAISLLASRNTWSHALVAAVGTGTVDAKEVSVDQIRQMLAHDDPALAKAIDTRWGKIRPATPGEKMAYVPVLGRVLNAGSGDLAAGRALFTKHCANCHTLFGEGTKVGPDLTTADRKNRETLLVNILDPSGYVRPEYVSQTAVLNDGRLLTGLVVASSAQEITIVDSKNQKTTVPRGEIEQIEPSPQSVMPERLLETLQPQEVRDLFRYLQSDGPAASAAGGK
jgi:putative heme-binding domain-containing protein